MAGSRLSRMVPVAEGLEVGNTSPRKGENGVGGQHEGHGVAEAV